MRTLIMLMTILRFKSIDMDCGTPPHPHSTNIIQMNNQSHFYERYDEYSLIRYECDSDNKELVGDSILRCFNGLWVGKSPKCATPTKSLIKKFTLYDQGSGKRLLTTVFLGRSFDECYKKPYKWNITSSQKILFEVQTNSRIDYFSLFVFSKDLINEWLKERLTVVARIERPRTNCVLETFKQIGVSNKTKISFKCFKPFGEKLQDLNFSDYDNIQIISIEFFSQIVIPVKYCSLLTFSFSDSCGSPERPLHSIGVVVEKSFVEFSCEEDFYLEPINGQKVTCNSIGEWNKQFPQCLSKSYCTLPAMDGIDHNIHVEYKELNYLSGKPFAETNSIAIYSCRYTNQTDIQLIGDHQRVCKKGFWTGSQPKCLEISKITRKSSKTSDIFGYQEQKNLTIIKQNLSQTTYDSNWHKLNLIIISMLVSFLIGAALIGFIIFILMKYLNVWRSQRRSTIDNIPAVVVSESNHYYERNDYDEFRYESLRLNSSFELLDLERINSLYQTTNSNQ